MKTVCDLQKGDIVWVYDHGKVRARTVEYAYMSEDSTGMWQWYVKLSRCKPQEIFCRCENKDDAHNELKAMYGRDGWYYNGYQKVWTDKDEFKKWLEETSNTHRRRYWKHNRLARMYESALDKMVKAMEELK